MASKQELKEKLESELKWKAHYQKQIEYCEQELSAAQKELSQPSLSGEARKSELKKKVKDYEGEIQTYKKRLLDEEEAIKQLQDALGQLTSASQKPDSSLQKETQNITSEATRLRIFSHPPAKSLKDDEGQESQSMPILYKDERIPETVLIKDQKYLEKISSAGKKIDLESDAGISIDIPEGSISPDESVDLLIQPCFSGPFENPKDMEPASPAYLIETSKQIALKKPLMMKMQHSVKLQTEEDCKNIVFLRASSDPEHRGSNPVYVFKEIEDVRGTFTIENQFGEVALTNFSWWRVFFRKQKIKGEILYSARLYRSSSAAAEVSAVFCMCPDQISYTQFCDKSIFKEYSGISEKAEGRTVYNALAITSDAVALKARDTTKCIMDKSEISKAEIGFPKTRYKAPSKIPDYPPRISISCTTTARSESLTLSTEGLEKECTFRIPAATGIAQPGTQTSNRGWFWWTVIAFSLLAIIFAPSYIALSSKEQTSVNLGRSDATTQLGCINKPACNGVPDPSDSVKKEAWKTEKRASKAGEETERVIASFEDTPQLTSKDHSTISRLLNDLNPEKLRCLGGALGLLYGNLQRMRNLLADMVSAWLNGEDDVTNMDGVGDTRSLEGLIQGLLKCNMKGTADEVRKHLKSLK